MNSSKYKELIDRYKAVISEVSGLYGYLGSCSAVVNECLPLVEVTKIDGESIDKGKLNKTLLISDNLKKVFNTVIAECQLKIANYEVLYAAALQAERAEYLESTKNVEN